MAECAMKWNATQTDVRKYGSLLTYGTVMARNHSTGPGEKPSIPLGVANLVRCRMNVLIGIVEGRQAFKAFNYVEEVRSIRTDSI